MEDEDREERRERGRFRNERRDYEERKYYDRNERYERDSYDDRRGRKRDRYDDRDGEKDEFGRDIKGKRKYTKEEEREENESEGEELIEQTEVFQILTSKSFEEFPLDHQDLQLMEISAPERMNNGIFCPKEVVESLWEQKNRMDDLFDSGNEREYYRVRDKFFPQDRKGSSRFWNRAGDKLLQVHENVIIFRDPELEERERKKKEREKRFGSGNEKKSEEIETKEENGNEEQEIVFIDVCGGPGAFSQLLLKLAPKPCKGFGITLKTSTQSDSWYKDLEKDPNFKIIYGPGEDGNVYNLENLEAVVEAVGDKKVNVVVADGGFAIRKDEEGKHMENYQELFSGRIILSETLLMFMSLHEGGNYVCKLFDSFSSLTASLIYVVGILFEETYIVKPLRSRIVNSERYLVGKKLKPKGDEHKFILNLLQTLHGRFTDSQSPQSVLPLKQMIEDKEFMTSYSEMCEKICIKQRKTLEKVMNEVDYLQKRKRRRRDD